MHYSRYTSNVYRPLFSRQNFPRSLSMFSLQGYRQFYTEDKRFDWTSENTVVLPIVRFIAPSKHFAERHILKLHNHVFDQPGFMIEKKYRFLTRTPVSDSEFGLTVYFSIRICTFGSIWNDINIWGFVFQLKWKVSVFPYLILYLLTYTT